jgi:hypothetical protein
MPTTTYTLAMRIRFILLTGVIAVALAMRASSQNENRWEDYKPRTLQSIITMHRANIAELNSEKSPLLLSGESFPSQVKLIYLADSRPILAKKKFLLEDWKKMLRDQVPPNTVELFPVEILFREGSHEHWIAVQTPLLEFLPKEVKRGQVINAYVVWMGAIKVDNHWEWLFAMNDFDAPKPAKQP